MTQTQRAAPSGSTTPRVVLGLLLLVAVASLMVGSALQSSLSGEFPPYGATASEEVRWAWGTALWQVGAALAILWAVLVVVFRKRIGLRQLPTIGVAFGGVAVAMFLAYMAWMVFLV